MEGVLRTGSRLWGVGELEGAPQSRILGGGTDSLKREIRDLRSEYLLGCLSHHTNCQLHGIVPTTDVKHLQVELTLPPHLQLHMPKETKLYRVMLTYQTWR